LHAHEGLIVAAPEYNAFVTPLLVNSIAWASRVPAEGSLPSGLAAMSGTVAGLLSASPGALGGQRALIFLRSLLSMAPGMLVLPQTASIGQAQQAFDEHGNLADTRQQQAVQRVVQAVVTAARALQSPA
jgi:chromate reductase, NAD(P)H dehydrogenase (quinone)